MPPARHLLAFVDSVGTIVVMDLPTPEVMRDLVKPLGAIERKVLGGLVAVWIAEPNKVRDREWTSQQFVHLATVAHGFAEDDQPASTEEVEVVRRFATERMPTIVRIGFQLFARVAQDMQAREGFTFEDAQECVRGYLEATG